MKLKIRFFILLIFAFIHTLSFAQNEKIKALFIYNITKYIEWPADKKQGEFIIGVIGDSPLYDALNALVKNKKVGDQTIVIQKYNSVNTLIYSHMLYLPDDHSNSLNSVLAKLNNTSTLLITDTEGFALKGSCINFIEQDSRLKFEVNSKNIQKNNLKYNSTLLNLGILVE